MNVKAFPSTRRRRELLTGVTLLLAALVVAHAAPAEDEQEDHHDETSATAFTVADFERFGVQVATAAAGEVDVAVDLPGEVRPNADRLAHIAPRFPGIVRDVLRRVGDEVRAGDVLAIVESETLSSYEVRAAFAGTVIARHIAPGEAARREEAAFIVADLSTVWVEVNVYQQALPQVRVGKPVSITVSQSGLEAEGTISYLSPIVDQATRTAAARVVLPNASGAWRPGLFVTATVFDPVPARVVVPRRALQTLESESVVFVVDGDRFVPRRVTIGRVGRTRAEITEGLAAGERYADQSSFLVKAELGKSADGHAH